MLPLLFTALVLCPCGGEKVYSGKVHGAKKPAVVKARSVFLEIEEYKQIVERGLTDKDPEYFVLLAAANRKFYAAVEKTAADNKYDCIAEEGTVTLEAPDVTAQVIESLKSP